MGTVGHRSHHGGGGAGGATWGPLDQQSWAPDHPGGCIWVGSATWCLRWSSWTCHPRRCPCLQLVEEQEGRGEEAQLWGETLLGPENFPQLQEADSSKCFPDHPPFLMRELFSMSRSR